MPQHARDVGHAPCSCPRSDHGAKHTRPPCCFHPRFSLDDLHWADPASLDLLRTLAHDLADLPILLIATYRADELTRRHPLYAMLPVLDREARAARLDLRPLTEGALLDLIGRYALPGTDAARLVVWLLARAEGNAFFTAQLLRALEDAGTLRKDTGGWALGDLADVGLPAPLRQVLDARLDRLGEAARHQLALAAVIGQEVPLWLWAAVAGTDEDGLLDTTEHAAEARLLDTPPAGDAVRFAHALVRETLYEGLLPARRRRVHRAAAEVLLATPAPDPDTVASHLQRAGDERATVWLIRAGERAQRARAPLTAGERYESALALLPDDAAHAGERGWLLVRLTQVRDYGDQRRNLAALDEAERLAATAGDRALAAVALCRRGRAHFHLAEYGQSFICLEAGVAAIEALPLAERARLNRLETLGESASPVNHYLGMLVLHRGFGGPYPAAVALGERLVG